MSIDLKIIWTSLFKSMIFYVGLTIPLPSYSVALNSSSLIGLGIVWLAGWILGFIELKRLKNLHFFSALLLFLLPFILHLPTAKVNWTELLNYTSKYSVFLALPLIIFTVPIRARNIIEYAKNGYFLGISIIIFLYLLEAFNNKSFILNKDDIPNSGTYLSLHLLLVIVFLYNNFKTERSNSAKSYFLAFLMLFCSFIIFSTPAKAQIIINVILLVFFVFDYNQRSKIKLIISGTTLIAIVISSYFLSPSIQKSTNEILYGKWVFVKDGKDQSSISMRSEMWKCGISLGIDNWESGVGLNRVQNSLDNCYRKNDFWGWFFHYNTHNQFIGFWVKFGIIGLLVLILNLFYPLSISILKKNNLLLLFLAVIILSMLTENIIDRNSGLILYAFFNAVFLKKDV